MWKENIIEDTAEDSESAIEKLVEELTKYIDDFDCMYGEVGGDFSSETGDHENWILGDGIQYGNLMHLLKNIKRKRLLKWKKK